MYRSISGSMVVVGRDGAKYKESHKKYPCDQCEYSADILKRFKQRKKVRHVLYICAINVNIQQLT